MRLHRMCSTESRCNTELNCGDMKQVVLIVVLFLGICQWSNAQNSLNFDGANDNIQTNYSGVLGSADRTFEAWIYVDVGAPSSNLCIVDYGLNQAGSRNTFSVSGTRQLIFISGGTNANISSSANVITDGVWTHVAFVLDSGTGYLYVNSVQVGSGSLSSVNTPANQAVIIGQRVNGGSIPFDGSIDELRIWDVAKSQTELAASMNDEICAPDPNLQLYLKFNQGIASGNNSSILTATDDSGNAYQCNLNSFLLSGSSSNWVTGATLTACGACVVPSPGVIQN